MTPRGYPVNLKLAGRRCLVVGGGVEAASRARNLLEAGADVLVLVGDADDASELGALHAERLCIERRSPDVADIDAAWLVVQVSCDADLARKLEQWCDARRVFFCPVDEPAHGSYSHLALARAGALTLAVGTEGRVPALGRKLRQELQRLLDAAGAAAEVERLAALRAATPTGERREVLARAVSNVRLSGALRFRK